jgi:ferric-dicitrate binding protein FerR (iron transport regulator)
MSDRATPAASDLYHGHLRECRECRRMHRLLYALYEGPIVPAIPSGISEEREFHAALRRSREERPAPWYHKLSMRAGVAALAGSAAVLTLALFDVGPGKHLATLTDTSGQFASNDAGTQDGAGDADHDDADDAGGIEHPAQSYGRIIGGQAKVTARDGGAVTDAFPVGTRFEVAKDQPMQVGLAGKLVANFTPGTTVEWKAASPILLELELTQGIAAVRYDRKPSDPILQVRTPNAVVRVVGTVFTVQVDDGDTRVSVLRGQVEVLNPNNNRQLAELESGFRYDVGTGTFADVGLVEVAAAMPLSNDIADSTAGPEDILALADGRIPDDWHVPGLPHGEFRTLEYVPATNDETPDFELSMGKPSSGQSSPMTIEPIPDTPRRNARRDDGQDIIEALVRDTEASKRQEMLDKLENCRSLYYSPKRRYQAASCLSSFVSKYGNDPAAAEGYLLTGMLRMDYALDYKAAEKAFETFLQRAPKHSNAEVAHYRMWLSAVEDGRISVAMQRARKYLSKYSDGRYVGRILQRFPELKSELH